ncbi:MAG: hypothetical protein IIX37_08145, partial [Selenomonadaceae bacterium]|nr:hypothetical protein [Selenomonadaceae bacterium]
KTPVLLYLGKSPCSGHSICNPLAGLHKICSITEKGHGVPEASHVLFYLQLPGMYHHHTFAKQA